MKFPAWLASLALGAGACASAATTQYPGTGFYIKNVTPSIGAPAYQSFVGLIQHQPNVTAVFIDYRDPIVNPGSDKHWVKNAQWSAGNLARMCSVEYLNRLDAAGHPGIAPIVSIGLTDEPTAFQTSLPIGDPQRGKYNEAAAVAMMYDIANGKYDLDDATRGRTRVWPAIFDAYRNNGFAKIYLRIGWEQNGNWYGWRVRNEATRAAYVAAWRHVADLAHAYGAANAMVIETVWSPSASYANYGLGEEASYPGDAYVDIVGPDAYSPVWTVTRSVDGTGYYDWASGSTVTLAEWLANPVNRRRIWDYPAADYWNSTRGWGLPAALAFARAHNKRFAFSETGTGNQGVTVSGGGPVDEGDFPRYLAERLSAAIAQGLRLEFIDVWAEPTGADKLSFLSGARPLEAAAWRELMDNMASIQSNVALGKRVTTSSSQSAATAGALAVDGLTGTSWISNATVTQWLQIDLARISTVSRVKLNWNTAYAPRYLVQVSADAKTWTTIFTTSSANGGLDDLVGLSGSGRYIRVVVNQLATGATNYSLREFEVYP
jgi:hypothetical protein